MLTAKWTTTDANIASFDVQVWDAAKDGNLVRVCRTALCRCQRPPDPVSSRLLGKPLACLIRWVFLAQVLDAPGQAKSLRQLAMKPLPAGTTAAGPKYWFTVAGLNSVRADAIH
jgi:hypothetical protein